MTLEEKLKDALAKIEKEGDRKQFQYRGYDCLIRRVREAGGHLCGYVVIPEGHKLFKVSYDDLEDKYEIHVHGGLTFSNYGFSDYKDTPFNKSKWYVGFDCHHAYDLAPLQYLRFPQFTQPPYSTTLESEEYRDMEYVTQECKDLVDQIIMIVGAMEK